MGDFQCFKAHLMKGNAEGVRDNLRLEFVDKMVDDDGLFPIHIACRDGFVDIVRLLLDRNCNIECENNWGVRPIHYASIGGHSEILKLLLDRNCNIECETNVGWRPIHWASWRGHSEILKLLLDRNCNIECETKSGWRPIHWASSEGHSEILKLLLQQKCQINCKTKDGKTALDLAKLFSKTNCVELLTNGEIIKKLFVAIERNDPIEFDNLFKSNNFIKQNLHTGFSVLQTAIDNNANRIVKCIIDKLEINNLMKNLTLKIENNENLIKDCILYLCIVHFIPGAFKKINSADVINRQCRIAGSSFLELAAEHGCDLFIDGIMRKTIYNKSIWIKAINKAKEKGFKEIQDEISERMILLESRQKVNFTILHTAICDNDADMVKYIIDNPNIVDLNSNNETLGTALALAHSLHHRKCIRVLQQYQLDTNTRNKYSETPLHEAISSGLEDTCEYLMDRSIDIDQTGFMGFTGLHCAVIRGMINVCAQLVNRGADYVTCVQISRQCSIEEITIPFAQSIISLTLTENALTLSMKFHGTLFPCFLDRLDSNNTNARDGENNSLLHLAVKCLQPDICSSLLNAGAQVDSVNNLGNTPLLEMFAQTQIIQNDDNINKVIDITKILIKKGANVNIKTSNGITAFQSASTIGSEKLMFALVSNNPKLINFSPIDFQTAFANHWFGYGKTLINLLSDNFLSANISNVTFQSCRNAETKLIKLLFDKSSSELQQSITENLLHDAVNNDDNELFDHLIKIDIVKPKSLETGETLLTFVIKEKKLMFAWKLLESINKLKFVSLRNIRKQSALQMAIEIDEKDLIDALIYETEEFNSENLNGQTVLTQLLEKISISNDEYYKRRLITTIKAIIQRGGDIYKITSRGQRIIDSCTDINVKEKIEEFFGKHFKKSNENKNDADKENRMCNICMDNHENIAFQCGHLTCSDCSDQLFVCPICNTEITNRIQIYFN